MKKTKKKLDLIDRAVVVKMLEEHLRSSIEWRCDALSEGNYFMAAECQTSINVTKAFLEKITDIQTAA